MKKRLTSLLLAFVMCIAVCLPVNAAEAEPNRAGLPITPRQILTGHLLRALQLQQRSPKDFRIWKM